MQDIPRIHSLRTMKGTLKTAQRDAEVWPRRATLCPRSGAMAGGATPRPRSGGCAGAGGPRGATPHSNRSYNVINGRKNSSQINDFQGPSEFENLTGKQIWQ